MKCSKGCGRSVPDGSRFKLCETCMSAIRRLSQKTLSEAREYVGTLELRKRRAVEVVGHDGTGPRNGGYVAILYVKRRARARQEREREARHGRPRANGHVAHAVA